MLQAGGNAVAVQRSHMDYIPLAASRGPVLTAPL